MIVSLVSTIIEVKPASFFKAFKHPERVDVMTVEYYALLPMTLGIGSISFGSKYC